MQVTMQSNSPIISTYRHLFANISGWYVCVSTRLCEVFPSFGLLARLLAQHDFAPRFRNSAPSCPPLLKTLCRAVGARGICHGMPSDLGLCGEGRGEGVFSAPMTLRRAPVLKTFCRAMGARGICHGMPSHLGLCSEGSGEGVWSAPMTLRPAPELLAAQIFANKMRCAWPVVSSCL